MSLNVVKIKNIKNIPLHILETDVNSLIDKNKSNYRRLLLKCVSFRIFNPVNKI